MEIQKIFTSSSEKIIFIPVEYNSSNKKISSTNKTDNQGKNLNIAKSQVKQTYFSGAVVIVW